MRVGSAYTWKLGHLYVVIGADARGNVAVVNFSRWEPNRDQTLVVDVGDHPEIDKKSVAIYACAELLTPAGQADMLRTATPRADVSESLLRALQEGTDSDYCPGKVAACVNSWCRMQRLEASALRAEAARRAEEQPAPGKDDQDGND